MGKRFARLAGIAFGGALLAAGPCPAQVRDADMKAAYIANFAQFTAWPAQRVRAALSVCVDRASALGRALQAYDGRLIAGRAWQVVDNGGQPGAVGCDILVLGRAAPDAEAPGTLVVRDGPEAASAAIVLLDDDENLRFDIDTRTAARAGIRFSSKLLRLARTVQ